MNLPFMIYCCGSSILVPLPFCSPIGSYDLRSLYIEHGIKACVLQYLCKVLTYVDKLHRAFCRLELLVRCKEYAKSCDFVLKVNLFYCSIFANESQYFQKNLVVIYKTC